jgi:hypothetical protein
MLTLKTSLAVLVVVGAVAASSSVTYAVMHYSMAVDCVQPASGRTMAPAPNIPTTNGERF